MATPTLSFIPRLRHARTVAAPLPGSAPARHDPLGAAATSGRVPARQDLAVVDRQAVHRLGLLSVVKVSAVFYTLLAVAFVVGLMALGLIVEVSGASDSIQKALRTLLGVKSVTFHTGTIAVWGGGVGLALVVVGVAANTLAALIYNLISRFVGGVRLDAQPPAPPVP